MAKTIDKTTYDEATNTTTVVVDTPGFVKAAIAFNGRLDDDALSALTDSLKNLSREVFLGIAANQSATLPQSNALLTALHLKP